jgi:hypothetical protein
MILYNYIFRDKDSDIRVKLTSVSRLHCRIKIDNGKVNLNNNLNFIIFNIY